MFLGCPSICACMRLCARAEAFSADLPLTYVHPTRFRSVEEENRQFIYNTDPRALFTIALQLGSTGTTAHSSCR